jgi:hypothetical protein
MSKWNSREAKARRREERAQQRLNALSVPEDIRFAMELAMSGKSAAEALREFAKAHTYPACDSDYTDGRHYRRMHQWICPTTGRPATSSTPGRQG